MSLLDHLQAIRDQHGQLTPVLVVEAARDPEHPLHSRFEWDDSVAAEKWRLEQASQLLRVVKLPTDPSRPNDLRAFVAVKGKDSHRADYVPTEEALTDEFARKLVLRDMEREWRLLKRRYEHMREFADLILSDLQEKAS
jgi:predicted RNA-binding protein YlxR (DUF448 family)